MRVLFIGKRHYTNRDTLEECFGRIYQLPLHWSRQGVQSQLWLIDYHGCSRTKKQDGALIIDSTPIRGLVWIFKAWTLLFARFNERRTTHLVASGDAYIGLLGWLLARLTGAYFVFDVYDKYDEFSGYCKPLGWGLFDFLLRRADQCWFASRRLLTQLGNPERGDRLVMNGIDTNYFKPRDMREVRQRLGLPEDAVLVGYFGSMEKDRGVTDLIEAVSFLRQEGRDIILILAGKNHPETSLPQVEWLIYLGNLQFDDIAYAYNAVNVFAIPYRRSAFMDAGASNKIAEALACGCLLVTTETPNFTDNFPLAAEILQAATAKPACLTSLAAAISEQLTRQIHVPMPADMGYEGIADATIGALKSIRLEMKKPARDIH